MSSSHITSNPGEQFYMFTLTAAWLLNVAGRPFPDPLEYDEPNTSVANILAELRALVSGGRASGASPCCWITPPHTHTHGAEGGLSALSQGVKVDFPPSKLKSGSGEHVCFVLDRLADEALKRTGFSFRRYPESLEASWVMFFPLLQL